MRVTQNQMARQYLRNSNAALNRMNQINNKILSQQQFTRASQNPAGAAKAMSVRRELDECESYLDNIQTADGMYSSAEESLLTLSSLTTTVTDSIIQGTNGTNSIDECKIFAKQIKNAAKDMVKSMNCQYVDRNLFGGTNNSIPPYVYNEATGDITYNGVDVTTLGLTTPGATFTGFPKTSSIYVDVGLGMQFDAAGNLDEQTVMDISLNGAEMLGYGVDSDGYSKNLIALSVRAAECFDAGDKLGALACLDRIRDAKAHLMISVTNLGNQQQGLDQAKSRVLNDQINLKKVQESVEGVDISKESTEFKIAEMAYNATLSMGAKVIPPSIFDYLT